ncbi:unnamed protein product [Didymodactylos carnosus]|uniref:Uncharacterized protein n=1 Tax=Didymodactylos carnosus TaxID=1234261 RepID=A0A8S2D271_9BILA|nr:unnamed protein product [Didymodactylos carnosus]CAF3644697.1 unnamed protein product [Didymodactylos carnosus]
MAHTVNDEKHLKSCLSHIIDLVDKCLQNLKVKQRPPTPTTIPQPSNNSTAAGASDDVLLANSQLNNNINTFTLNADENQLLDELTSDIQGTLEQSLPHLSKICSNYVEDFLHSYHYDRGSRTFTSSLTMNVLCSFYSELKGLLAASEAFPAAFNGQLTIVKDFLKQYPMFKDKPGLWETTLLYSAARNNRFDIVKYLIEQVHCSVNAQNQRDMSYALDSQTTANFTPRPTAASTALHGACFNSHLPVVQYLVEHGADYFIKNQAYETPIMNGEHNPDIKQYFQDYLVLGYSAVQQHSPRLPDRPIMDEEQRPSSTPDCLWEYKPIQDREWYKFSSGEAHELHQALLPSKEEFQQQIHLKVRHGLYNISMIEFIRSGKSEQEPQKNMAWVRCRGSSILNFDCFSIWQLMLIQHPKLPSSGANLIPSLQIKQLPTLINSRFKLQLNTWYSCDAKTNSLLDDSMNYRRKQLIAVDIPFVDDQLQLNLQTFTFTNNVKTIAGHLRWIPKLISNSEQNKLKVVHIDNYQTMTNLQPIPLTTKHLKEVLHMKNANLNQTDVEQMDQDDDVIITPNDGGGNEGESDDDDNGGDSSSNKNNKIGPFDIRTFGIYLRPVLFPRCFRNSMLVSNFSMRGKVENSSL